MALARPGEYPGKLILPEHCLDQWHARSSPCMRDANLAGPIIEPPEARAVRSQVLDDSAQTVLDRRVDLEGGARCERRGQVRQERLEMHLVDQAVPGASSLYTPEQRVPDQRNLSG